MRHAWKYAAAFGFITAALSAACTVTTDDDVGTGGTGGTSTSGGTGGTTGGTGGTNASGGTGGSTGGTGGSTGGTGGSTGGTAATGGTTGGTGDTTGGTGGTDSPGTGGSNGGTGGDDTTPTCDPADGSMVGTPYPDCEPQDADDDCEACIQTSCCEESMNCYATDPFNVCGWGGPPSSDPSLPLAGEIACYRDCLTNYVNENGVCDPDGISGCAEMCATPMCGGDFVGGATSDLAACMQTHCSKDCFGADACDAG
jgi:hypothetical protein